MMPSPDMSFPVPLIHISETNSTNSYLQTLCAKQQGVAAFTTVVADFQTSGRGQRGNSWESEPKKNLLFSFVLFPDFLEARRQFLISQIVSLAIKEELDSYADDFSIKWPNDIYWKDKKICGMLIENDLMGRNISQSISGIRKYSIVLLQIRYRSGKSQESSMTFSKFSRISCSAFNPVMNCSGTVTLNP